MFRRYYCIVISLVFTLAAVVWGVAPALAGPGGGTYYANSPAGGLSGTAMRKFVDGLPGLGFPGCVMSNPCGTGSCHENNLCQYIPVAQAEPPATNPFPGSDYYEIGLRDYTPQMHSDLPGPTQIRGYYQKNGVDHSSQYLGPLIVATENTPVRIKFFNELGQGAAGNLPIPVDETIMGAGMAPDGMTIYNQNRATVHLHGGFPPWLSDGTPHQWITPAGDLTPYPVGMSTRNLPDMMPAVAGVDTTVQGIAAALVTATTNFQTTVNATPLVTPAEVTAANDIVLSAQTANTAALAMVPGNSMSYTDALYALDSLNSLVAVSPFPTLSAIPPLGVTNVVTAFKLNLAAQVQQATDAVNNVGYETFFYPNQQSARLMFYHDHAYGITRLNVYAGEAAGYLIRDNAEAALEASGALPDLAHNVPLIIQDKTFVPKNVDTQDALWNFDSQGNPRGWGKYNDDPLAGPLVADLWFPHIYEPNQMPPSIGTGAMNPLGRWDYGPLAHRAGEQHPAPGSVDCARGVHGHAGGQRYGISFSECRAEEVSLQDPQRLQRSHAQPAALQG